MNRYKDRKQIELVNYAIEILPIGIKNIVKDVNFVFDYSPEYIGLLELSEFDRFCGIRTSENTCFYMPLTKTIVLHSIDLKQYKSPIDTIWHELGHHIDECLDYDRPIMKAFGEYEKTNIYEAFAGAFVRWMHKDRSITVWGCNRESLLKYNRRAVEFFNKINCIRR